VSGRILTVAAVAALGGACASVRPMTQVDREAASRQMAQKQTGTVVTEGQLFQMDLDRTFVCGVEPQVGSHIPRYQCRSLRRVTREREAAKGFTLSEGTSGNRGFLPGETAATNSSLAIRDLVATRGAKLVKDGDPAAPARTLPSADQDPRFPPL
jgi:hypothetical protein